MRASWIRMQIDNEKSKKRKKRLLHFVSILKFLENLLFHLLKFFTSSFWKILLFNFFPLDPDPNKVSCGGGFYYKLSSSRIRNTDLFGELIFLVHFGLQKDLRKPKIFCRLKSQFF